LQDCWTIRANTDCTRNFGAFVMSRLLTLLTVLSLAVPVLAQPKLPTGDEMVNEYLKRQTAEISKHFLDGATSRAEWEGKFGRLKGEYLEMLGLSPLPEKTALHATITGTVERGDIVIDKLHYQSRPGLYVTANLYRPKNNTKKLPAILYVCGHSGR